MSSKNHMKGSTNPFKFMVNNKVCGLGAEGASLPTLLAMIALPPIVPKNGIRLYFLTTYTHMHTSDPCAWRACSAPGLPGHTRAESGPSSDSAQHALAPLHIAPAGKGLRPENAKKETLIKENWPFVPPIIWEQEYLLILFLIMFMIFFHLKKRQRRKRKQQS